MPAAASGWLAGSDSVPTPGTAGAGSATKAPLLLHWPAGTLTLLTLPAGSPRVAGVYDSSCTVAGVVEEITTVELPVTVTGTPATPNEAVAEFVMAVPGGSAACAAAASRMAEAANRPRKAAFAWPDAPDMRRPSGLSARGKGAATRVTAPLEIQR